MSDGLIRISSLFGFDKTVELLTTAISLGGMRLVTQIDHSAAAHAVGMPLRRTLLLIFGNAQAGTPLMLINQEAGIDLPLKFLVWDDEGGETQVSYNEPAWIAERHALTDLDSVLMVLEKALTAAVGSIKASSGVGDLAS